MFFVFFLLGEINTSNDGFPQWISDANKLGSNTCIMITHFLLLNTLHVADNKEMRYGSAYPCYARFTICLDLML